MYTTAEEVIEYIKNGYIDETDIDWYISLSGILQGPEYKDCIFTAEEVRKLLRQCK